MLLKKADKKQMKKANIVIYGYDYENTERIIDMYTKGIIEYHTIYIDAGAHREDRLLCHLRIGEDIHSPYIFKGKTDILHARTWEDAGRFFEWMREKAAVYVEENRESSRIREIFLKKEREGLITIRT